MAGGELLLDLSGYKDKNGTYVPDNDYLVVVEDVENDKTGPKSKNPGSPMVILYLRVIGGEYDGATLVDRMTVTPNALFRIVGFMQAIGLKVPKKKFKINTGKFVGKHLLVSTTTDEWNGAKRANVAAYARAPKGTDNEAPADLPEPDEDSVEVGESDTDVIEETATVPAGGDGGDEVLDLDELGDL